MIKKTKKTELLLFILCCFCLNSSTKSCFALRAAFHELLSDEDIQMMAGPHPNTCKTEYLSPPLAPSSLPSSETCSPGLMLSASVATQRCVYARSRASQSFKVCVYECVCVYFCTCMHVSSVAIVCELTCVVREGGARKWSCLFLSKPLFSVPSSVAFL